MTQLEYINWFIGLLIEWESRPAPFGLIAFETWESYFPDPLSFPDNFSYSKVRR